MAGMVVEAGSTTVVSTGFFMGRVSNSGPGTAVIEGATVPPGGVWASDYAYVTDIVVSTPCGQPCELQIQALNS